MKSVIIHDLAEAEIIQAADYYEARSCGLGHGFVREVYAAIGRILDNPARWPLHRYECRRITLRRFPYSLFYLDLSTAVWVIAVAPQRRRPYYWRSRLG